jgi:valyl-tRNA synthetase
LSCSALWPFSTLGWHDLSKEDYKHFYPSTVLEKGYVTFGNRLIYRFFFQWINTCVVVKVLFFTLMPDTFLHSHDILFFWFAQMVMMGIEFTGSVSFSYVYLHGFIWDAEVRWDTMMLMVRCFQGQ